MCLSLVPRKDRGDNLGILGLVLCEDPPPKRSRPKGEQEDGAYGRRVYDLRLCSSSDFTGPSLQTAQPQDHRGGPSRGSRRGSSPDHARPSSGFVLNVFCGYWCYLCTIYIPDAHRGQTMLLTFMTGLSEGSEAMWVLGLKPKPSTRAAGAMPSLLLFRVVLKTVSLSCLYYP